MRPTRLEHLVLQEVARKLSEEQGAEVVDKSLIYGGSGGVGSAVVRIVEPKALASPSPAATEESHRQ